MEKWFKKFTMYDESQGSIATDSTTPLLGLDNVVGNEVALKLKRFAEQQTGIPDEIQKIIDDNFWDML